IDSSSGTGKTVVVNSTTINGITGSGAIPQIAYNIAGGNLISIVNIFNSDSQADTDNVQTTMAGSTYNINTGTGVAGDTVNISNNAAVNTGTLGGIQGP